MTALGDRYGRWTVTGEAVLTAQGERKWLCRCACGTERRVVERSLVYGGSVSCGCLRIENANRTNALSLAGKTFGELTALHPVDSRGKRGVRWLCRCSCGKTCEATATRLASGRKTSCGCRTTRAYAFADITGRRFHLLTALYPTPERAKKGGRIWHCRCDCGTEVDVPYNELAFSSRRSCGCLKREHDGQLAGFLTHVDGTSLDMLRSKKIPANNTTGVKGVYRIRGKYVAKIVFQKKQYYLGGYDSLKEAAEVRREAEEILAAGTLRHYERWKRRADADPAWAQENPIRMQVEHHGGRLSICFLPVMDAPNP